MQAWAEAMASAGCLSVDASTAIIAEVWASIDQFESCKVFKSSDGLAGGSTSGSAVTVRTSRGGSLTAAVPAA